MPPNVSGRIPGTVGRFRAPAGAAGLRRPGAQGRWAGGGALIAEVSGGAGEDTATDATPPAAVVRVAEPRPYSRYPAALQPVEVSLFDGPPHPADVVQGMLNDCAVLATCMAIAHANPEVIAGMFSRRDTEVHCRSYSDPPGQYPGRASVCYTVRFRDREVELSNRLYYTWGRLAYAHSPRNASWMCFLEKAFAMTAGGNDYNRLDDSAGHLSAANVFERLVGPYQFADIPGNQLISSGGSSQPLTDIRLNNVLRAAETLPAIVATGETTPADSGLEPNHAFAVLGLERGIVRIRNPRGGDQALVEMTPAAFRRSFVAVIQAAGEAP